MIRYYTKDNGKLVEVDHVAQSSWVNITTPFEHGELERFANEHNIPLDFLTDSLDIDERSRYEREDYANLVLINIPILNDDAKENEAIYITIPVGLILFDNRIVTVCAKENPIITKFLENKVKNFNPENEKRFVLQFFEQTVFAFLDSLKKLNLKRGIIEQELYSSSRNEELQQLLRIEKSLVYFVNSLSANELLKLKMKRTDLLSIREDELLTDLFEDIIIDNGQALEMSNVHTNILSGTMEAYASIVSNNMNQFINRLTIITITLMVPTLVYSFYGMNIPLPFKDWKYMYLLLIALSVLFIFFMLIFLRKKA